MIDPKKAFGMKATNSSYTLEFKKNDATTTITAIDLQTRKLSFWQRLSAAWSILWGSKDFGEYVFPLQMRTADFYYMSYIFRPEAEKKASSNGVHEPATRSTTAAKPAEDAPKKKTRRGGKAKGGKAPADVPAQPADKATPRKNNDEKKD
jgi:hypothetical protein